MNGIYLRGKNSIADTNRQKLWDTGVRYVYADIDDLGTAQNAANDCAYQGFKFGVHYRLRYPPEQGSVATQLVIVGEKLQALQQIKGLTWLPFLLVLERSPEYPFCETNMYRNMVDSFLAGMPNAMVRMNKATIDWLTPSAKILARPLWLHAPTKDVQYAPWKQFAYRSYAERDIQGTMAEWVEEWVQPQEAVIEDNSQKDLLSDSEKIDFVYQAVKKLIVALGSQEW